MQSALLSRGLYSIGRMGEWGKCSKPCDGVSSRYRNNKTPEAEGMKELEGDETVATHDCPVDVDCVVSGGQRMEFALKSAEEANRGSLEQ